MVLSSNGLHAHGDASVTNGAIVLANRRFVAIPQLFTEARDVSSPKSFQFE